MKAWHLGVLAWEEPSVTAALHFTHGEQAGRAAPSLARVTQDVVEPGLGPRPQPALQDKYT